MTTVSGGRASNGVHAWRCVIPLLAASLLAWSAAVRAEAPAPVPFVLATFEAAQRAGKPILVEVTAPWCPVCKAQVPILDHLRRDRRFRDLQTFTIDFDTGKTAMQKMGAKLQSTLICFKGTAETGRSVGETQPEWIEAQLEKAL